MAQKYRSNTVGARLDQFYTNPLVAKNCFNKILRIVPSNNMKVLLEPSAGNGSFSDHVLADGYNCIAVDLDPKKSYIRKMDFFNVDQKYIGSNFNETCAIGNPPFGKNSSLAVKFFNHCAKLAATICFVVPKTFKKQSIHNRLNLRFHLKKSIDLPKNSFIFNGEKYDVPCVFQIWQWKDTPRKVIKSKNKCALFEFVDKSKADLAVRRVGGRAGTAFLDVSNLSEQSNHFCRITNGNAKEYIVDLINNIDFKLLVNSTAGVRSLSKGELIRAIERKLNGKDKT